MDEEAMRPFVAAVLGKKASMAYRQAASNNLSALKAQMLGASFPPLHDQDARSVSIPVLLLTGDQSPAFLYRLTGRLGELLPNAQTVHIPPASHLMHEQNHATVNTEILIFLTAQRRATI